jgi:prophage regulatory protein
MNTADVNHAQPSIRILRLPAVEAKSGLKRDSIYRLAKLGQFPKPIKISQWASGWVESEIEEYLAKRIANRDAKA